MKSRFHVLLALMVCGIFAQAQESDLDVQEVQVVEEFVPMVPPARKIVDIPQVVDTVRVAKKVQYTILNRRYETAFQTDTIKPAKIKGEPIEKLYQQYFKIGLGNAALPSLEAYYNSLRDKQWSYGFALGYHRSAAKVKRLYDASFQENKIGGHAKGVFDFGILKANISREGNVFSAHGSIDSLTEQQMRQYWAYSQANLSLESKHTDRDRLRHRTVLHLSDLNEFAENNFRFSSELQQRFGGYDYSVAFKADYYTNNTAADVAFAAETIKEGIYTLSPRFYGEFYGIQLKAGFDEVVNNKMTDTVGLNFYFYPQLRADYEITPGVMAVYAGLRSGLQKNSYWSLSKENPFVLNPLRYDGGALSLKNTSTTYDLYAGLDAYAYSTVRLGAELSYAARKNMAFFLLDYSSTWNNKFDVRYFDGNHLKTKASIAWQPSTKKGINLSLEYHHYQFEAEVSNTVAAAPFYKPSFRADLSAFYNLGNKIIGHLDVYGAFGRDFGYHSFSSVLNQPQDIIDVDFAIEYRYSKVLSAYLKGNRLIGGYDIWQNYPVVSPQIQLGISYQL